MSESVCYTRSQEHIPIWPCTFWMPPVNFRASSAPISGCLYKNTYRYDPAPSECLLSVCVPPQSPCLDVYTWTLTDATLHLLNASCQFAYLLSPMSGCLYKKLEHLPIRPCTFWMPPVSLRTSSAPMSGCLYIRWTLSLRALKHAYSILYFIILLPFICFKNKNHYILMKFITQSTKMHNLVTRTHHFAV